MSERAARITTEAEAIEMKQRIAARNEPKKWRYFIVRDPGIAALFANANPPCVAGEVAFSLSVDNETDLLLFY